MKARIKWYLAARFEDKVRIRGERERLRALGHTVISTWLDEEATHTEEDAFKLAIDKVTAYWALRYALRDLSELKQADAIILDTQGDNVRAGREVEWGITLTRSMRYRIIVGPKRNVFHELCSHHFQAWDEVLEWLAAK